MTGVPIIQIDAFTDTPFRGNPAAVCMLSEPRDDRWMQDVAREMNLSETAFLRPAAQPNEYALRWFTPAAEVDLCGHATLASAHMLWEHGYADPERPLRFHTRSGVLSAERQGGWIEMDFPATPVTPCAAPAELAAALGGVAARFIGCSHFDLLVELESAEMVRALAPDLTQLARIDARGVIVTSRADTDEHDFISRFFAPRVGVPEDPVTGSAHCSLAPFWAERLGRDALVGHQASARGGVVRVRHAGDRVRIAGQAVTVLRAEFV